MLNYFSKYKLIVAFFAYCLFFAINTFAINNDILNTHIIKTKDVVFNISYIKKFNTLNKYKDYYVFLVGVYLIDTKSSKHLQKIKDYISLDMPSFEKITKTQAISNKDIKNIPFTNTRAKHFLIFFNKNKDYDKREIKLKIQKQTAVFNTEFFL